VGVLRSVLIESDYPGTAISIDAVTINDDLPVRLRSGGVIAAKVEIRARVESAIQTAIRIDPGELIAGNAVHFAKVAGNDRFAIRLRYDAYDIPIRSAAWIVGGVK